MNVIELAEVAAKTPGLDPPHPAGETTLRLMYGLPLPERLREVAMEITGMSWEDLQALEGHEFTEVVAGPGRRSWKTALICALPAVRESLFGGHEQDLMPGERAMIPIISKDIAGSKLAIRFVTTYLDCLGVKYEKKTMGAVHLIEIPSSRVDIACLANRADAPRGYAMPAVVLDEVAHWSTADGSASPDHEVIASCRPAMAQFKRRLLIMASSPLARHGVHYETMERHFGNSTGNVLAVRGPTWVWNPRISREKTRELEPDERVWRREYAAQAQAAACALLDADAVERCFEPRQPLPQGKKILCIDPSAGKRDTFAWAIIGWTYWDDSERWSLNDDGKVRFTPWGEPVPRIGWQAPDEKPYLKVYQVGGWKGVFWDQVSSESIVKQLADLAKSHDIRDVVSDQYESHALQSLFRFHGMSFHEETWTGPSKQAATGLLRRLVSDRQIAFPEHVELRRELLSFEERITPSGHFTYDSRGTHADYLAAILTGLMYESNEGLPHSNIRGYHGNIPRKPVDRSGWSIGMYI